MTRSRGRTPRALRTWATLAVLAAALAIPAGLAPTRLAAEARADARGPASVGAAHSIPLRAVGEHWFFEARIGDSRPLDFLFDTGASTTAIAESTARELGLRATATESALGSGGRATVGIVPGVPLSVGGLALGEVVAAVLPLGDIERRLGHRIDGVLGYDLLAAPQVRAVTLDPRAPRLRIHHDRRSRESAIARGARRVRFDLDMRIPTVQGTIRLDDGTKHTGRFLVDTGAGLALALNTPFVDRHALVDRLGPGFEAPSSGIGDARVPGVLARVPRCRILDHDFEHVPVTLSRTANGVSAMPRFAGIVGNAILRRFHMTLDYDAEALWLAPVEPAGAPFAVDASGLSLRETEARDGAEVFAVIDGTPAAAAGIRQGEVVVAIDGHAVPAALSLAEARRALEHPGRSVEVALRRADGSARTATLRLERYR